MNLIRTILKAIDRLGATLTESLDGTDADLLTNLRRKS